VTRLGVAAVGVDKLVSAGELGDLLKVLGAVESAFLVAFAGRAFTGTAGGGDGEAVGMGPAAAGDFQDVVSAVGAGAWSSQFPKPQRPALLTALITTEAGIMHPIYRQLADHAGHHLPQQAYSVWIGTVEILHGRYRNP
jgi:hypothetical protein